MASSLFFVEGSGTDAPLRAVIADDHVPTRTGVRMALEQDGIEVCAEAGSAAGAIEAALRERPDVCLLDVQMPGGGVAAASMISFRLPETVVLMLTVSRSQDDLLEALRRGAAGYLLKDIDPARLPVAVRAAMRGEAVFPRALGTGLIEQVRQRPAPPRIELHDRSRAQLTRREWEVLELLDEGAATEAIAGRLFLSRVTVRRHISNILAKLDVATREEAIALVRARRADQPHDGSLPASSA
jgi:DNA-binding NarL/FixJ family response regulator